MKDNFVSYLASLKFDPRLLKTLHAKYLTNYRIVILLIATIIILGIFSFFQIPRRLNPEIKIPIVSVVTVLPGASPTDVETLLTVPIEDKLENIKGIDSVTSTSLEGVSSVVVQFLSTVDLDKAKSDVQSAVDGLTDLPSDSKTPSVKALDFEDRPVWNFSLSTDKDDASLMKFSQRLKDYLKEQRVVDRVEMSGFEENEVVVTFKPTKLREFNLSPLTLLQLISANTKSYPAGSLKTDTLSYSFTIDKNIISEEDIRKLKLTVNNQVVSLSDLAVIRLQPKVDQPMTYILMPNSKPRKTVQFFVYKASSVNIDSASSTLKTKVSEFLNGYENVFHIQTVSNTGDQIDTQFKDLYKEFQSTIILVFINLLLFLGLRQAVISSVTVPLTFLSAFTVLNIAGMSLNFLTMFAFLLALGLLIDDTIVSVAAMTRYYATGKFSATETGLLVWRDFIVPLWSTTITTIWAFVPLLLTSGIIGEFIKPIPIVVTSTLVSSTSIAVLVTIPLMMMSLKSNIPNRVKMFFKGLFLVSVIVLEFVIFGKNIFSILSILVSLLLIFVIYINKDVYKLKILNTSDKYWVLKKIKELIFGIFEKGLINTEYLSGKYMQLISRILSDQASRRKTLFSLIIFSFVAYLLIPLGLVKNEFFPKTDQKLIYVNVDLASGTNYKITEEKLVNKMSSLKNLEGVDFIIGETGARIGANGNRTITLGSYLLTIHLVDEKDRKITSFDLAQKIRDGYVKGRGEDIQVIEQSSGPPAGADLQIKLLGDDLSSLDTYADKVMVFLKKQKGVTNVEKSLKTGTGKIVFVPDATKIASYGLTIDSVGLWLRTFASGFNLKTIKIGKEDTDVVFNLTTDNKPEELGSLMIPTYSGNVPLLSLGKLKLEANPSLINREEGKRTVSVSAAVMKGYTVTDKNKDLSNFATKELNLPKGYSWKIGGVNEENQKSVNSIFQAMGLSFLLILITMVIEFRSYRQAIMIMLLIPLAISGVFYVFALTQTPLSFPALIGVLALFGLVVTNGIVVIEKINDNRHSGMNLKDAIIDASGSRLEPILLTSITSILGLVPITISNPLWRGLGGAIISGLLFSGAIKLFFVPVVYYMWYQGDEKKNEEKNQELTLFQN